MPAKILLIQKHAFSMLLAFSITTSAPSQGPKTSETIQLLGYHCSLDLPQPHGKIEGEWFALSYLEAFTVPNVNKGEISNIYPVKVVVERCGGQDQGEAFPDSPRPRIIGGTDLNVHWLIRGIQSHDSTNRTVKCAQWSNEFLSARRYRNRNEWQGIFDGKPVSIKLITVPVKANSSTSSRLIYSYDGVSQTLITNAPGTPGSIFIGDIDFDGQPDLIVSIGNDKGISTNYLFLSSKHSEKQLVKCVDKYSECND